MPCRHAWVLLGALLLASCTGKAAAVRAAQPYLESFGELRSRALNLLELRSDVERKRLLVEAMNGDEDSLPENLKPVFEQMRAERVELTEAQLDQAEGAFWRMLDFTFSQNPNVLQAELVFLEKDGSVTKFRHPRESELPAASPRMALSPAC